MDYRELPPEFEKAFDAFVSIEMVEVKFFALVNVLSHLLTDFPPLLSACRLQGKLHNVLVSG